jgi:hypothetical protein
MCFLLPFPKVGLFGFEKNPQSTKGNTTGHSPGDPKSFCTIYSEKGTSIMVASIKVVK